MIQSAAHATENRATLSHVERKCLATAVIISNSHVRRLLPASSLRLLQLRRAAHRRGEKDRQAHQHGAREDPLPQAAKLVIDERYDEAITGLDEAVEDFTVAVAQRPTASPSR